MKVELIYFDGCPNAEQAHSNLKKAIENTGCGCRITEWKSGDEKAPDYVRQYGSPTILIDEKDIAGGPGNCCASDSCRIYEGGVPSVEAIQMALRKGSQTP